VGWIDGFIHNRVLFIISYGIIFKTYEISLGAEKHLKQTVPWAALGFKYLTL
jgi:hypothetical protein